jgi:putative peptidoglycan lipid II flippase
VPVLARRLDSDGPAAARRTLSGVLGLLLAILLVLVSLLLLAVWLLPAAWLEHGGEPGGSGARYAEVLRTLLFVLLPYLFPVSLLTLAAAAQNVTGRFSLPAIAPALLNLAWIAGLLWVAGMEADLTTKVVWVAGFLLAGGWCQLLSQLPGLRRSRLLDWPRLTMRDDDVRQVVRNMLPMVLGLSVVQLNTLATQLIAAFMIPAPAANSILFLANRMLEFPHALLGVALGTAVFPLLSVLGGRGDLESLRAALDRALSIGLFLALPATAGLLAIAPELIGVLFVTGRFTAADGVEAAAVLRILCLSLPGLIAVQILARTHYARGDMRSPVRIAVVLFFAAQAMNLLLAPVIGTIGLACSSAFGATANAVWLLWSLRRSGLPRGRARVMTSCGRVLLASLPAGIVAWAAVRGGNALFPVPSGLWFRIAFVLVLPAAAGALAFLGAARVLRLPELMEVLSAWRARRAAGSSRPVPPPPDAATPP